MSLSLFRNKSFIGLDLGSNTIKAVQMERTQAGWKVVRAVRYPTPKGAIQDGVVTDVEAVTAAIGQMLKDNRLAATSAVIGVSGGSVIVRSVRIPNMPEAVLRKSIKFEASRYVPSSIEDSYIEFEIVGPADDDHMEVLIVAAPKEIVESRIRACEGAGLEVEIVDVEAFAAYRSLIEAAPDAADSDETLAIIDIGSHTANVSVVQKGVFAMTRSIPQAGSTLTDALKSYFKLSDEDAESGKAQLDLTSLLDPDRPTENPPIRVIQPFLDDQIREIRRSLNYYQSQQTEAGQSNTVSRLILCGGGAALHGMADYVGHKLGIETVSQGVLDNPRFAFGGNEDLGSGLDWTVAIGLAMRPFAKAA
ncbi:MAG: type IV pilus assembly protein PilM [Armatimonadetes bacterium]|nr:type IV pilus assembly protein PilM [Armatimonadota bacterium]